MGKIKCVAFDFGDTLVDSVTGFSKNFDELVDSKIKIFKKAGYDFEKEQIVEAFKRADSFLEKKHFTQKNMGVGYEKNFLKSLGIKNEELAKESLKNYIDFRTNNTKLFPRTEETLIELKKRGFVLGVVTDTFNNVNRKIAIKLGIKKYFSVFVTSSEFGGVKKELKIFEHFLKKISEKTGQKILPEDCLMVGNHFVSDTVCKKIGMRTVILTKKMKGKNDPQKILPDYYIDDISELVGLIEKINKEIKNNKNNK